MVESTVIHKIGTELPNHPLEDFLEQGPFIVLAREFPHPLKVFYLESESGHGELALQPKPSQGQVSRDAHPRSSW